MNELVERLQFSVMAKTMPMGVRRELSEAITALEAADRAIAAMDSDDATWADIREALTAYRTATQKKG